MTIIYLALQLLVRSSELPNLLLHQSGFTTPLCHHRVNDVAPKNIIILFTFLPQSSNGATWDSIVSAALSLGFRVSRDSILTPKSLKHSSPSRSDYIPVVVNDALFQYTLPYKGCSDFPPHKSGAII